VLSHVNVWNWILHVNIYHAHVEMFALDENIFWEDTNNRSYVETVNDDKNPDMCTEISHNANVRQPLLVSVVSGCSCQRFEQTFWRCTRWILFWLTRIKAWNNIIIVSRGNAICTFY